MNIMHQKMRIWNHHYSLWIFKLKRLIIFQRQVRKLKFKTHKIYGRIEIFICIKYISIVWSFTVVNSEIEWYDKTQILIVVVLKVINLSKILHKSWYFLFNSLRKTSHLLSPLTIASAEMSFETFQTVKKDWIIYKCITDWEWRLYKFLLKSCAFIFCQTCQSTSIPVSDS